MLLDELGELYDLTGNDAVFESIVAIATIQVLNEQSERKGYYVAGLCGSRFFGVSE